MPVACIIGPRFKTSLPSISQNEVDLNNWSCQVAWYRMQANADPHHLQQMDHER